MVFWYFVTIGLGVGISWFRFHESIGFEVGSFSAFTPEFIQGFPYLNIGAVCGFEDGKYCPNGISLYWDIYVISLLTLLFCGVLLFLARFTKMRNKRAQDLNEVKDAALKIASYKHSLKVYSIFVGICLVLSIIFPFFWDLYLDNNSIPMNFLRLTKEYWFLSFCFFQSVTFYCAFMWFVERSASKNLR